uniref:Uncharacterized protein n=1 Tax=Ralstonia solanacearum TaxID=305 RepID=A0A0S4TTE2_RALSL|nr:protein of unknown function [Ralstonia solanacearum]
MRSMLTAALRLEQSISDTFFMQVGYVPTALTE